MSNTCQTGKSETDGHTSAVPSVTEQWRKPDRVPEVFHFFCRWPSAALFACAALALDSGGQELSVPQVGADSLRELEDEVVHLSPFEIDASDDAGYRSTNATSGTSLNAPIRDIPMSVEVINRDFLDDTGAIDFDESLQYSAGVVLNDHAPGTDSSWYGNNGPGVNQAESNDVSPSSRGGLNGRFSNAVNIRGFNVPFQNRDGFRYGGQIASYGVVLGGFVDTLNISRFEVVRGPNSLLYGIGVLSGITNMIPKRPLPEPAGAASIAFGNFDYRRATIDWTAPLNTNLWGGVLSYRVAAALTHRRDWADFRESDIQYYVGQLQFTNDKWTVFLEGQYADQKESGIGPQFVYDNLSASIDQAFRSAYGEKWNWQKDVLGLPQTTRITGPDTYDHHQEYNLLFNVDTTPIENLTLSAGAFITEIGEEEFNTNISTLTNGEGNLDLKGVIHQRLLSAERAAAKDPEDRTAAEAEEAAQASGLRDWFETYVWIRDSPEKDLQVPNDTRELTDYRTIRYWWRKTPKTSETQQVRLRGTYTFETVDFLGEAPARHTLLAGFHAIHDEADFTTGPELIGRNFADKGELSNDDPLLERSPFDPEPIRYNGESLALPGLEMRHVDVWYKGLYALYQGRLFNDNLGVIAGLRWDEYHARNLEYDRFDEHAFIGDAFPYGPDYVGSPVYEAPPNVWWNNPDSETYGFVPLPEGQTPYEPGPDPESATTTTLGLNYRISPALTVYGLHSGGLAPNVGERDGNNDPIPSEQTTSEEIGVKFDLLGGRLSGSVAVYRIRRENALWYGSFAPAPAKWLGHPNPAPLPFTRDLDENFDPRWVDDSDYPTKYPISYGIAHQYFTNEGIELGPSTIVLYDDDGNAIRREYVWPEGLLATSTGRFYYLDYGKLDEPAIDKNGTAIGKTWRYFLEKAFADRGRRMVSNGGPEDYNPMTWSRLSGASYAMNPGIDTGATITFTDQATGCDLQLLYQPTPSWQLVFNYAHTEREPDGPFKLVEIIDAKTGFQFGTEYDPWVRVLGREAFGLEEHDDDGDGVVDRVTRQGENEILKLGDVPTSNLVGGLEGISLYTGPEDTFSLFQKYSFLEGFLRGFEANLGITFIGPARTSIPIGGPYLAENLYGTPPTPDRWIANLGFTYHWRWGDQRFAARLQVFNLLDDQKGENSIVYADPDGNPVPRRTTLYHEPRNFRFNVSVQF